MLLDAPAAMARELVGRKGARGYTTLEADIHESDAAHGDASRAIYLELARRDGWRVVATAAATVRVRDGRRDRERGLGGGRAAAAMTFDGVSEQHEAKRLLVGGARRGAGARLPASRPAGRRQARPLALLFAAELLGDHLRVERRTHPDLYVLEPVGDQIRIDDIRELRRDLHMRPFEAARRVYLILDAHTMNEDAADALLKDLEEPPSYAVIVLVADELGPLPGDDPLALPARAVPAAVGAGGARGDPAARAPELPEAEATALARVAGGPARPGRRACSTRRRPSAARRCSASRGPSTSSPTFDAGDGAQALLEGIAERGAEAKERAEETVAVLELAGARGRAARAARRSAGPSATSCSRRSRSSSGGTATSSSSPPAPRRRPCTSTGSTSCARTRRRERLARRRARVRARPRGLARGGGAPAVDAARARGAARPAAPRARRAVARAGDRCLGSWATWLRSQPGR